MKLALVLPTPKFTLRYIEPPEVKGVWESVRPWVLNTAKKTRANWTPEDVHLAVMQKRAYLHIPCLDGEPAGVVVLTIETEAYTTERSLTIWIAASRIPYVVEQTWAAIENVAKQSGAKQIGFHTSRPGWMRRAKDFGFKVKHWTYVKEL